MMSQTDTISDALTRIKNGETASRKEIVLSPASKLLGEILSVMKEKGYVGEIKEISERHKKMYKVQLMGKINHVAAIKPRYAVKKNSFEKYEKRYLPARDIGTIIVSTSQGVMSHTDTKEKAIGGRLLAYVY